MSLLSGNTKKVSVYGRKAEVRVVNRQSAFTAVGADENDPFGFFTTQAKPRATYGRSRASVLPSQRLPNNATVEDEEDTLDGHLITDQSSAYDTANSSASFHSACSSTSSKKLAEPGQTRTPGKKVPKKALANKTLNAQEPRNKGRSETKPSPVKSIYNALQTEDIATATPKARKRASKRALADSPQTVRKPRQTAARVPTSKPTLALPTESTPPPSQPTGRVPRRAAQAARMAIEDYDFTDRDMTPRRPVPTKSYFVEKARQLAELAQEEEQDPQPPKRTAVTSSRTASKEVASVTQSRPRKSLAARPRRISALGTSRAAASAASETSSSSTNGVTDSSFEGSTSQSSFSLIISSSDNSYESAPKPSATRSAKLNQNKRITRRIAASSDDEDTDDNDGEEDSDNDVAQDTEARLAARLSALVVADGHDASEDDSYLAGLLATVSQKKLQPFADTIQRLRSTSKPRRRLEKIGEASYSEVFKLFAPAASSEVVEREALVLKIIPIADSTSVSDKTEGDDVPYSSPAADVEREIRLMQLIRSDAGGTDAFVTLRAAHVVRGMYPAPLLQAWDRWDAKRRTKTGEGAENIRPHVLGDRHVYAVLVMTDAGTDLESLRVESWLQAASIFWQVTAGLGAMEARYEFEHRDLHWGNILVQPVTTDSSRLDSIRAKATREDDTADNAPDWLLDPCVSGIKATIIDFTLSRASVSASSSKGRGKRPEVLYYPFDDESLFDGSGDAQFEVYREMRMATKNDWQTHHPATNMLWLRYLAHKLIDEKCKARKTPKPATASDPEARQEMRAYTSLHSAASRLDRARQRLLDGDSGVRQAKGRNSLHPRSRKSVHPASVGGVRNGVATTAVTEQDALVTVRSAAQLMALIDQ